jgi:transposase
MKSQKERLSVDELKYARKQAIRLHNGKIKMTHRAIAQAVGVTPTTIGKWLNRYNAGGESLLRVNKRGPKVSHRKGLTQEQEQKVRRLLIDKMPEQLKFPFSLWTLQAVCALVEQEFQITLTKSTICRYLKKWKFTPQKPVLRAYNRNDAAVSKWLNDEYPAIKKQAQEENAEILWGDETGIRNDEHKSRCYAPEGQTPVAKVNPVIEKINMVSAISNQGKLHFMFYRENMTVAVFKDFLRRLIQDSRRKIFLIVDNMRVHHAKMLKGFLRRHGKEIRMFFLPSYSPDLNPDEFVNRDLKSNLSNKPFGRAKGQIAKNALEHMEKIAKDEERVKRLFHAESVKYAM